MSHKLSDFVYDLPPEKIAHHPLKERDASKLLIYHQGRIQHSIFNKIIDHLPSESLAIFNNTKVIPARLYFTTNHGARVEIFLLESVRPAVMEQAMEQTHEVLWQCMIGNLKRWKGGTLSLEHDQVKLYAELIDREKGWVAFSWTPSMAFSLIVERFGAVPLPPYIPRAAAPEDQQRYQTIYGKTRGAVAAPTAGLHFTDRILDDFKQSTIDVDFVTLHVGAGTFLPIKCENIDEHQMHAETVVISKETLQKLMHAKHITAVGTTSLRLLESIYWYGVLLATNQHAAFSIPQTLPKSTMSRRDAIETVLNKIQTLACDQLQGRTAIFITPGYQFRMVDSLLTNFHQPRSSLLLLIAAFIGDGWRNMYDEALKAEYRFLSYGDCCLLIP